MKKFAKEFINDFINLFFPSQCMGCSAPLIPNENKICVHCQLQIPFTYFHLDKNNPMSQKLNARMRVEVATALCYFEENSIIEQLIYQLKYKGQEHLGVFFGSLLEEQVKVLNHFQNIEGVIPVPLHPKRKQNRGYNQTTLFGKTIAEFLEVPFLENAIVRTKNTEQLVKATKDRDLILENAFRLDLKNENSKHLLLVDDVFTTGATLHACGSLLLKNPINRLSIATIGYRI